MDNFWSHGCLHPRDYTISFIIWMEQNHAVYLMDSWELLSVDIVRIFPKWNCEEGSNVLVFRIVSWWVGLLMFIVINIPVAIPLDVDLQRGCLCGRKMFLNIFPSKIFQKNIIILHRNLQKETLSLISSREAIQSSKLDPIQ